GVAAAFTGYLKIRFGAENKLIDLPVVADLATADDSGQITVDAFDADIGPSITDIGTNIKSAPGRFRRNNVWRKRRRLVRDVGSIGLRAEQRTRDQNQQPRIEAWHWKSLHSVEGGKLATL